MSNIDKTKSEKIGEFVRDLLTQPTLPLTAKYIHNQEITITLQLTLNQQNIVNGYVLGYKPVNTPKNFNPAMVFADVYYTDNPQYKKQNTFDALLESTFGNVKLVGGNSLVKKNNLPDITKVKKVVDVVYSSQSLIIGMFDVISQAERLVKYQSKQLSGSHKRIK